MKVQTFFIGIIAAFALPWLLIVAYPFMSMKNRAAVEYMDKEGKKQIYYPRDNKFQAGAEVYQQENCQACHTQLIRNSYSGSEIFRQDWAGSITLNDKGEVEEDTRRESISWDYREDFASLGERRTGPDLINYGLRVRSEVDKANEANAKAIEAGEIKLFTVDELVYLHLYNPRHDTSKKLGLKLRSNCASNKHLFTKVSSAGQGAINALPLKTDGNYQIIPSQKAKALKDYLVGRIRHDDLPRVLNKGGEKKGVASK